MSLQIADGWGGDSVTLIGRIVAAMVVVLLVSNVARAQSDTYEKRRAEFASKVQPLKPEEEVRWIEAAKSLTARDGATVLQILEFAQKLRRTQFKFGEFSVGYNGATGAPSSVNVEYWIGEKRLPDDAYAMGFEVFQRGSQLRFAPTDRAPDKSLLVGRQEFLDDIDRMYEDTCVDPARGRRLC